MQLVCAMSKIHIRSTREEVRESGTYPSTGRMNYRLSWDQDVNFMSDTAFTKLMALAPLRQGGKEPVTEQLRVE